MEVFWGTEAIARPLAQPVVAIGNFDGMHLGHRRLVELAIAHARPRQADAVALTFDPHPARVLAPEVAPPLLTTLSERLELLGATGLDAVIVQPFGRDFAALSATDFVDRVLVERLGAGELVVGYDFTYGAGRAGSTETLRSAGRARGFAVTIVEPVSEGGLVASSTRIRGFLLEGRVEAAARLLGRPHRVTGLVVRGDGRGRTIGIPTANVEGDGQMMPRSGVYAGQVAIGGQPYDAVINLGTKPTFGQQGGATLEAHLLDFGGDLYGQRVAVTFTARLRDEQRFAAPDALVEQIRKDIVRARELARRGPPSAAR